jgi:hypothetical protein
MMVFEDRNKPNVTLGNTSEDLEILSNTDRTETFEAVCTELPTTGN